MNVNALKPVSSAVSLRKAGNWLDGFHKYCSNKGSPDIFVRWAGIFTIAAALERKTWLRTAKGKTYPNIYTFFVGPPGAGKTLATKISREFLRELKEFHLAPSSVTKASLIDALDAAKRYVIQPGQPQIAYNSLTVISDELGVFLEAYENNFMAALTNIWDNEIYTETRRSTKLNLKIEDPQLSIIAATTPSYLNNLLPEGAWDQGFLSRVMLVYSGAGEPNDIFAVNAFDEALKKDLLHDLNSIYKLYGAFTVDPEAASLIGAWHKQGGPPVPSHPKLQHYNTRRTQHLLKLCMVASVASTNDLHITSDHFAEALDWLVELEHSITDIFKSMKSGGDTSVIEETYHFVYTAFIAKKQLVSGHRVSAFVSERTPAHNVARVIEVMCSAGLLEKGIMGTGIVGYKPGAKQEH